LGTLFHCQGSVVAGLGGIDHARLSAVTWVSMSMFFSSTIPHARFPRRVLVARWRRHLLGKIRGCSPAAVDGFMETSVD
jgi:hypothetical protein